MYFKDHNPPHFHARYEDDEEVFAVYPKRSGLSRFHLLLQQLLHDRVSHWAALRSYTTDASGKNVLPR